MTSVQNVERTDQIFVHSDRITLPQARCAACRSSNAPARWRRGRDRAHFGTPRVGSDVAWYSTESRVISMNASSSEERWVNSSWTVSWCAAARSPTASVVSPSTSMNPSTWRGLGAGRAQRVEHRLDLRRPDPYAAGRVLVDEVGRAGVGQQPAAADHDQVLGGQRHLAHQVAGDEDGPAPGGQRRA